MTGREQTSDALGREPLAKYVIARASDVPDGARVVVEIEGRSIGVFNVGGSFYAILNRCPHMGAELCKGDVIGLVESDAPGDFRLDESQPFLACPWHGWEYDLETGQSWFSPGRTRARRFPVEVEHGGALTGPGDARPVDGAAEVDPKTHRVRGPFVANVFPVSVDDDYIVVTLGAVAAARPATTGKE
jgi:3-phenylpropionate/trans-cinnamate dioxygenase ferredoxin subunit